eukprot:TRINITY_DN10987_c0_g1_i2.p1 TRINITY_DN10987_c0_g1~~TRINITY_DN10987_c0_g1_i2.p1  ORF type:complete len:341 (+),score=125.23 TRINITY_DN10987_c0_g1_i2:92-1114(+)
MSALDASHVQTEFEQSRRYYVKHIEESVEREQRLRALCESGVSDAGGSAKESSASRSADRVPARQCKLQESCEVSGRRPIREGFQSIIAGLKRGFGMGSQQQPAEEEEEEGAEKGFLVVLQKQIAEELTAMEQAHLAAAQSYRELRQELFLKLATRRQLFQKPTSTPKEQAKEAAAASQDHHHDEAAADAKAPDPAVFLCQSTWTPLPSGCEEADGCVKASCEKKRKAEQMRASPDLSCAAPLPPAPFAPPAAAADLEASVATSSVPPRKRARPSSASCSQDFLQSLMAGVPPVPPLPPVVPSSSKECEASKSATGCSAGRHSGALRLMSLKCMDSACTA